MSMIGSIGRTNLLGSLGVVNIRGALGKLLIVGSAKPRTYTDKIKNTQKANLIGYWPLNGDAKDYSGNGFDGAATNITYGDGVVTGQQAAVFDGTAFINLQSAGLAAAFNGVSGTLFAWFKVAAAGVWADSTTRSIWTVYTDANNELQFYKRSTAGQVARDYTAGSTALTNNVAMDPANPTGWCWGAYTWDDAGDSVKFYLSGAGAATPIAKTGVGTWSGALTKTLLGANATAGPGQPWSGSIAHVAIWNTPLSAAQIADLVVTTPPF